MNVVFFYLFEKFDDFVSIAAASIDYRQDAAEKFGRAFFGQTESPRSTTVPPLQRNNVAAPLALPLSPDSGQYMRLRGGAGPWEGYLEVRSGKDRPWGHVCDISDNWTLQEASVVCRHLGFLR